MTLDTRVSLGVPLGQSRVSSAKFATFANARPSARAVRFLMVEL
jgi:hypothetical protein